MQMTGKISARAVNAGSKTAKRTAPEKGNRRTPRLRDGETQVCFRMSNVRLHKIFEIEKREPI